MPTVTPSTQLRSKIALALPAFVIVSDRLVGHPRIRELYPEYLFVSHCVIRASVPLMETARDVAATLDDPVAERLVPYFEHHIPEELDHDEWLLGDLELLGFERRDVLRRPPVPTVAALAGAQYYWIHHYHPVALLGYIGLLEGYPPSPAMIDRLRAGTGYPPGAFHTMVAHAELDPGHGAELDELLDTLPLEAEQATVMALSALHTIDLYTRAVEDLLDDYAEAA
jgi:Iron-containing redox enzyme